MKKIKFGKTSLSDGFFDTLNEVKKDIEEVDITDRYGYISFDHSLAIEKPEFVISAISFFRLLPVDVEIIDGIIVMLCRCYLFDVIEDSDDSPPIYKIDKNENEDVVLIKIDSDNKDKVIH